MSSFVIRRTFISSPSIRNPSSTFFKFSVYEKSGLLKNCAKNFLPISSNYIPKSALMSNMRRTISQNLNISGKKLLVGSSFGLSAAAAMMYNKPVYAMDDNFAEVSGASGYLKDDLHTFWSLARKFELPIVFLVMVMLGWKHPITLVINIALLLLCTKPSSSSIYLFIEELRKREMRQNPSPYRAKFLYVKNVEVEDYKVLCYARVNLRDAELDVIGILGGWWVVRSLSV